MARNSFSDKLSKAWSDIKKHLKFIRRKSNKTARSYLKHPLSKKQKRYLVYAILFIIAMIVVSYFAMQPIVKFVSDPQGLRIWAESHPVTAVFAFIAIMFAQIFIAVLPGEPVQLALGYTFGWFWGLIIGLIGAAIASALVFLLVKRFGRPLVEIFFPAEKIDEIDFLHDKKRMNVLLFILMMIPGTPKDLFTYAAGLLPMSLTTWLLISVPARIPGILGATIAGEHLGQDTWYVSVIVLSIVALLAVLGIMYFAYLTKQSRQRKEIQRMRAHYREVQAERKAEEAAQKREAAEELAADKKESLPSGK